MKVFADWLGHNQMQLPDGRWAVKKPLSFWGFYRFRRAWDAFTGLAVAVYFLEDCAANSAEKGTERKAGI